MDTVEKRLKELGLELPPVPKPMAKYVPAKMAGDLVFTAGQGPMRDGKPLHVGKVGSDITEQQGYDCARLCALNCLAAVKGLVGSLDRIEEVVQVRGFVNCGAGFDRQPEVVNGASDLLVELFGDRGRHARSAVGTCSLPRNIAVELEMVVRVRADRP
jgi:enamine deaminase RidA (YjgF/YER057c/UK114 family)